MSVRRLAEASVQPKAFAFAKKMEPEVRRWMKKYPKGREQSAVIPLLMLAQEQEGWVSKPAIEHIGTMLGMPFIRVLEVATFYTQFQLNPVGTRAHIQVCGTTPCMLRGSEALMDVCRSKIHPDQFHLNAKGTLSWEEVECLGACVNAPMVMVFKDTYEDLTPERLSEIIDDFEAGKGAKVETGPQNGRVFAAPITGYTTLQDKKAISKAERQRLAKEHAKEVAAKEAAKAAEAATVAAATLPSEAAKPKTSAIETSPAIKSPSPVKVSSKVEKAASVEPAPKSRGTQVRGLTEKKIASGSGKDRSPAKAQVAPAKDAASQMTGKDAVAPAGLMVTPKAKPAKAAVEKAPELLKKPRSGKGDDLKLIWGVGPKLEKMLNGMGVWHFDQIASWGKAELNWVDDRLEGFKGRASRDEWVKQSKKLAKGWRPDSAVGEKPV
jgi:NADH-quinone oxidoreductase subunit E